jgi:hypothetical protein
VNLKTSAAKKCASTGLRLFELHRPAQEPHDVRGAAEDLGAVLKWSGLCKANAQQWSSANGQAFATNEARGSSTTQ